MNVLFRALALALLLLAQVAGVGATTFDVAVSSFRFTPNDLTIQVGDTVRWTNTGGFHNVRADDGSWGNTSSSAAWTFSHTFTAAGDVPYFCSEHAIPGGNINTGMNGIVRVVQGTPAFQINQGIPGSWFNPATSGQGMLIDLALDPKFMFVAWFTYEKAPPLATMAGGNAKIGTTTQRWLTASGPWDGNTASLTLYSTGGGVFDNGTPVTTLPVGTLTLTFENCSTATAAYSIPGEGLSGTIPISRSATIGMGVLCQSLIPATAE